MPPFSGEGSFLFLPHPISAIICTKKKIYITPHPTYEGVNYITPNLRNSIYRPLNFLKQGKLPSKEFFKKIIEKT
jgi:hypothetical protein